MQYSFFENQIERLRAVYSPGSLNVERIKVLWDSFKATPDFIFERAVNNLIGEFTTMALPSVSRFREAILAQSQSAQGGAKMQEFASPFKCEKCRDFGFIFVGDDLMPCILCETGRNITGAEIERQEEAYKLGKEMMGKSRKAIVSKPLPYDPNERIA